MLADRILSSVLAFLVYRGSSGAQGVWDSWGLASRAGPPEQDLGKPQASLSLRYVICKMGLECRFGVDVKGCENGRLNSLPYNPLLRGT